MPLITPGTPVTERLTFNSGKLDLSSTLEFVDVDNITVDISFTEKELRVINSIKMASHKRASFKCGFKAKIKAMSKEALAVILGASSSDTGGVLITTKDGQYTTALNPVLTCYIDDDATKPIQFQFTDAIIIASPVTYPLEDYGSYDIDASARDVSVYYKDA